MEANPNAEAISGLLEAGEHLTHEGRSARDRWVGSDVEADRLWVSCLSCKWLAKGELATSRLGTGGRLKWASTWMLTIAYYKYQI